MKWLGVGLAYEKNVEKLCEVKQKYAAKILLS